MDKVEAIKRVEKTTAETVLAAQAIYDDVIREARKMRNAAYEVLRDAVKTANEAEEKAIKEIEESDDV